MVAEAAGGSGSGWRAALPAALLLSALLFCVYMAGYGGRYNRDDEHVFVSAAQGWARWGAADLPQVWGNSRLQALRAQPFYSVVEPGHWWLGAQLLRIADALRLGSVQVLLLVNPLLTALTAGGLLLLLRAQGHALPAAALTALGYGSATFAWVYTRTYFREPLAALLLTAAALCVVLAGDQRRRPGTQRAAAGLALAAVLAAIVVKLACIAAVPALLWLALPALKRLRWRSLFGWTALLFVGGIVLMVLAGSSPYMVRISLPYFGFVLRAMSATSAAYVVEAVLAMFVSPARSLFLHAPFLMLSFYSMRHARTRMFGAAWLLAGLLITLQAVAYGADWWAPTGWGMRPLLPALPLLVAGCAPAVDRALQAGRRNQLIAVLGVGVGVQLLGAAYANQSVVALAGWAMPRASALWNPLHAELAAQLRLLLQGQAWELAAVHVGAPWLAGVWLLPILGIVIAGRRLAAIKAPPLHLRHALGVMTACLALAVFYVVALHADPGVGGDHPEFAAAASFVEHEADARDVVLVQFYGQPLWHYFSNSFYAPVRWYALPLRANAGAQAALAPPATRALLAGLPLKHGRVWLVSADAAQALDPRAEYKMLAARHILRGSWHFAAAGIGGAEVFLFELVR